VKGRAPKTGYSPCSATPSTPVPCSTGAATSYSRPYSPRCWTKIETKITAGEIGAVDAVRDELDRHDDDTRRWARAQHQLFHPLTEDVQRSTLTVLGQHPKLMGTGGNRNAAGPFVIGLAHARGCVVVTEETLSGRLDKPRIPDVCSALGLPWTNLVGFIGQQGWQF